MAMKDVTPLKPLRMIGTLISNVNNIQSMIFEEGPEKNNYTMISSFIVMLT